MTIEDIEDNRHSDPPSTDVDCPTCQGRGWLRVQEGLVETCAQCEGAGTVSLREAIEAERVKGLQRAIALVGL